MTETDEVPGWGDLKKKKFYVPHVTKWVCAECALSNEVFVIMMYSIFHKIPNASVTIFFFFKYFGILCLILKHELCKVIHSTHYVKFWKLKKK